MMMSNASDPAAAAAATVICRVPLPTWGVILMLLPASLLLLAILFIPFWEQNFTMIFATCSALVGGFILYPLMSFMKEREWVAFSNLQFDFTHSHEGNARSYTIHASGGLNYDPTYNAGTCIVRALVLLCIVGALLHLCYSNRCIVRDQTAAVAD